MLVRFVSTEPQWELRLVNALLKHLQKYRPGAGSAVPLLREGKRKPAGGLLGSVTWRPEGPQEDVRVPTKEGPLPRGQRQAFGGSEVTLRERAGPAPGSAELGHPSAELLQTVGWRAAAGKVGPCGTGHRHPGLLGSPWLRHFPPNLVLPTPAWASAPRAPGATRRQEPTVRGSDAPPPAPSPSLRVQTLACHPTGQKEAPRSPGLPCVVPALSHPVHDSRMGPVSSRTTSSSGSSRGPCPLRTDGASRLLPLVAPRLLSPSCPGSSHAQSGSGELWVLLRCLHEVTGFF